MIEPPRAETRIILLPEAIATGGPEIGAADRWPGNDEDDTGVSACTAPLHMPATRERRPRHPKAGLLAPVLLCLALMAALGWRERTVRLLPPLARAYAAIGLPVNLRGLEIRTLKSSLLRDGGGSVLAVEGEIVNIRPREVAVPQVRIGVESADGHEIYTWTTAAPKARLAGGETIDFRARLTTPPAGAQAVLVKFAAEAD